MKRNKTQHQLNRIKVRAPRFFWTHCRQCNGYFKREPMFFWRVAGIGPSGSFRVYNCMVCCPTKAIVIENNERYFGKHNWNDLRDAQGDKHALENEKLAAPLN